MAISARDLYFAVRVEDRATRPLRRIAADMRALGRTELASRQRSVSQANLAQRRAENARRAAATEFMTARRALEIDNRRARASVQRAQNIRRNAATEFMAARRMIPQDIARVKREAEAANIRRRSAASDYLRARSGSQRLALERKLNTEVARETTHRLRQADLLVKARRDVEGIAQAELRASRLTRLIRAGRATRGSTLAEMQEQRRIERLRAATGRQALRVTEQRIGLAPGEILRQEAALKALAAEEAELNAREASLASTVRARGEAYRAATAKIAEAEIAAGTRTARIAAQLRAAREAARLAESRMAEVEIASSTRVARAANRLRAASEAYRLTGQRVKEATRAVDGFRADRIEAAARATGHLGRVAATAGAFGVAAFGFLGKAAADFNTEAIVAATQSTKLGRNTVIQVQKNAAMIEREILKLMQTGQVVATSAEQTAAAYQIFSGLTFRGTQNEQLRDGIQLLKEFNRLTTANFGLVTLEESTRAGIILINDFGVSLKEVPKNLNIMQAAVRFGRMTMSEFIGTLNQAAPAAKAAGFSFEEMASAITFLSRKFPSLRMAATSYARLVETFARKKVIDNLKQQGVAITDAADNLLPLDDIIEKIVKRYPDLAKGGVFAQNFFKEIANQEGTIQARRGLTFFAQDLKGFREMIRFVHKDVNELDKSFRAAQTAPGVRWAEFTNQLKGLSLMIGQGVVPAVADLANQVQGLANWFNELSPHTKQAIGYFGILISVGTVLGGVILAIGGGVYVLGVALKAALAGLGLLGAEGGFAVVQFSILLTVFASIALILYKYPSIFHEVTDAVGGTTNAIEILIALLVARRLGFFAAVTAEAVAATGAVTALSAAVASFAAIGVVTLTIVMVFKLLNQDGSPLKGGFGVEAQDFFKSVKESFKHPFDVDATINMYAKLGKLLGTHDVARQAEHDLRETVDRLGTIATESGKAAQVMMDRQFSIKPRLNFAAQAELAAKKLGVDVTPQFQQLYIEFIKSGQALDALLAKGGTPMQVFEAQTRRNLAKDALQQYADAALDAAKALEELMKKNKKFSDAFIINEAKNAEKLRKVAENKKTFAAWKAYFQALKKLGEDASDIQMQVVNQIFDTTAKKADKLAEDLKSKYANVLQTVQGVYDGFLQQNQSAFGELFQGPWMQSNVMQDIMQWGGEFRMVDLTKDLRMSVSGFKNWRRDIETLRKRGLPDTLVDEIIKLGPKATKEQVEILKKATPAQLAEYGRLWNIGQKQIHAATMRDVTRQLKDWQKHGRRIALAIAQGLRSENVVLEDAIKGLIRKMFPKFVASVGVPKAPPSSPAPPPPSITPRAGQTAVEKANEIFRYTEARSYGRGTVVPGMGRGDTVPAMLTPGELVLNQRHQAGLSRQLGVHGGPHALFNRIQGFRDGGLVQQFKVGGPAVPSNAGRRMQFDPLGPPAPWNVGFGRANPMQKEMLEWFWGMGAGGRGLGKQEYKYKNRKFDAREFWKSSMAQRRMGDAARMGVKFEHMQEGGVAGFHHDRGEPSSSNLRPKVDAARIAALRLIRAYEKHPFANEKEYPEFNWHNLGVVLTTLTGIDPKVIKQRLAGNFGVLGPGGHPLKRGERLGSPAIMGGAVGRAGQFLSESERWLQGARNASKYVTGDRIFYHGSSSRALAMPGVQLSKKFASIHGLYGPGIYFTSSRSIASSYAKSALAVISKFKSSFIGDTEMDIQNQVLKVLKENPDYELGFNNTRQVSITTFKGLPDRETGQFSAPPVTTKHWKGDVEFLRHAPAAPHVRMARLAIKKAFDVEKPLEVTGDDLYKAMMKSRRALSMTDTPISQHRLNWWFEEQYKMSDLPKTNDELYNRLQEWYGAVATHSVLRNLGYDAIKYPGGKALGGRIKHEVYVLIRGAQQIRKPFGAAKKMAEGGLVTGPTHALIGEKGPELVIPLDRLGSSTTSTEKHVPGETVHYHITTTLGPDEVKKQLATAAWRHKNSFNKR